MGARHVFLETNWLVACFAPAHFQMSDASNLLHEAKQGRISLHIPSICMSEARSVIRRKFQPRSQADNLRNYLRWAKQETIVSEEKSRIIREVLDTYENVLLRELDRLEERLATLGKEPGVEVFPLTDRMLERSVQLGTERLELDPVDNSILAAVLTRADELKSADKSAEIFFCELDSHLQPWDKFGNRRLPLAQLYDDARVWVYGDFSMKSQARPEDWPT
jgi:predicted nucleic acid-binding protein